MWFTADTHFGHSNIIGLTHRPFSSVQEMDRRLIANINDRVSARFPLHLGRLLVSHDGRRGIRHPQKDRLPACASHSR